MSESEPIRILYMEDDPDLALLFKQKLERAGYVVDVACDGGVGLAMYAAGRYDVVAVDQTMPVHTGLEVIRRLASPGPLPPTLMVTGSGSEQIAVEAMKLGASDYLIKDAEGGYLELLPFVVERLLWQRRMAEEKAQALKAMQESEARYRGLFDGVPVGLYRITPEGRVLDANLPIVEMLGYPDRESLLALTPDAYLSPEDRARFPALLQREGGVRHFEMQMRRHDGTSIWVQTSARAVKNAEGQVLYYEGSVEDITARKQVEDALRRRNRELALLNLVGQELGSTLDLDQVLNTVLGEVRRLMGVIAATVWLVDRETGELVCRQNTGPHASILRGWRLAPGQGIAGWVAQYGESLSISDTRTDPRHFKRVDKTTGVELRSILAVPLKAKHDVIGVLQVVDSEVSRFDTADLTLLESLAASSAIAIENARLYEQAQQEIEERRRAEETLRQRTVELQARNEELDAFAHTVAHDLKGVATKIMGYSMILEEDYAQLHSEELQEYLHIIGRDGRKMSNIIDELLLLAGVRKQEVQMTSLDMGRIVTEALQRIDDMIKASRAEIILPDAWPAALGYGPWVEEVWVNYLSNAIKYGGKPPRVELGFSISDSLAPDDKSETCPDDRRLRREASTEPSTRAARLNGSTELAEVSPKSQAEGAQPEGRSAERSSRRVRNLKSFGLSLRTKPEIRFWVRDNGRGLTPEAQTRLFTPFTQLSQIDIKGHGLGLSIVQRIVEKLNGQVGVESTVGQGSVFSFTLPGVDG